MNTRERLEKLLPREKFEEIRQRRNDRFNLRVKMTMMVAIELIVSIAVAIGISALLRPYLNENSRFWLPVILILTSVVVGTAVTAILSKQFFDPIWKLNCAMEKIADGDFSVRLEDQSTSKELMEVYTGFNMMAHELGTMEMLQSDFVSNVSHEFKTPINAIEGYSMLLQGSENLSEEQNQYVEKILFNTQRLSSLVSSILLLSKLENQQIQTNQTTYRLDEQIRQSIVLKEPEWEKMRHVWDNLIGNAIKFDPQYGLIRIQLTEEEDAIRFSIEDSGPGLGEEALKHIYDKFYQGDSSHKEEGNGLGLSLVKRILSLENGTIQAENLSAGGCRFTVVLKNNGNL